MFILPRDQLSVGVNSLRRVDAKLGKLTLSVESPKKYNK
jgi:hypothetical protein